MQAKALLAVIAMVALVSPAFAGSATLQKSTDGHWRADAKVNGRPTRFLVDTGASAVALTPRRDRRQSAALRHPSCDRERNLARRVRSARPRRSRRGAR